MGKQKEWRRFAKKRREEGMVFRDGKANRIRGGISIQKHAAMLGSKWSTLLARAGVSLEVNP